MNKEEILRRIARYLMLHTSHQSNLGLLNGKMGVAIFFFHYAEYTAKKLHKDFADELINEIYKEIHVNYVCDFKDGLAGIAWGVEYLVHNRFVEGDTNEILVDLDRQILERDVRRIQDCSLDTGLKGLAYYVISRSAGRETGNRIIPEDYIVDLLKSLQINEIQDNENYLLINDLRGLLTHEQVSMRTNCIERILDKTTFRYKNLFKTGRTVGISNNGYAGIGLKMIKEYESENIHI